MTNKFDWQRMYKAEEHIEREAYSAVEHEICNQLDVEDVSNLTQEQMDQVMAWREENVNEYSPMYVAFQDVYNVWENENDYTDEW